MSAPHPSGESGSPFLALLHVFGSPSAFDRSSLFELSAPTPWFITLAAMPAVTFLPVTIVQAPTSARLTKCVAPAQKSSPTRSALVTVLRCVERLPTSM